MNEIIQDGLSERNGIGVGFRNRARLVFSQLRHRCALGEDRAVVPNNVVF